MNKSLARLLIGATIIAILIVIISQFSSALSPSWPKYKAPELNTYNKNKVYNSYSDSDGSNWRNKKPFSAKEYKRTGKETYSDNYYYKPRFNSKTQSFNWRY